MLKQDVSDLGHFVQNGPDNVAPLTINHNHDICHPIQNLSIRCEIGLYPHELYPHEKVNVKSKEFSYEGSDYRCDMNILYIIIIGNSYLFLNQNFHCMRAGGWDFSCVKHLLLLTCMLTGALSIALLVTLVICLVKSKKVRDFRREPKVDINDTYGTYDITGELSDYTTVEDTNDYYGQ